jgi:UMF1 family MFS transporter
MTQPTSKGRIFAWAMFDFADTIFSMNVVSLYFAVYIIDTLGKKPLHYSLATSISMILVVLLSPLLGQRTDIVGRRKPSLFFATFLCCATTALIGIAAGHGQSAFLLLALFVVANTSYHLGLVFYNSLLPDIAPAGKMGWVSGVGVALGYVGAIFGMLIVMPFNEGTLLGWDVPFIAAGGRSATFVPSAILFFLFSLPTFIWVREKSKPQPMAAKEKPFEKIIETLRDSKKYPGIRRFLLANFLFQEGIQTAIVFMAVYSQKAMGMPDSSKVPFFIISTIGAAIGSWIFGRLTDTYSAKRILSYVLVGWIISLVLLLPVTSELPFYILGVFIGALLGGVPTAARPLLVELAPPEAVGRFFGLFSLSGKAAAIVGPLIWGIVVLVLEPLGENIAYRGAVVSLLLLIASGYFVLLPLKTPAKR